MTDFKATALGSFSPAHAGDPVFTGLGIRHEVSQATGVYWMPRLRGSMTAKDMHDIKWIREHKEEFDRGLARRGLPGEADKLLAIDERLRGAIQKAEAALARRNVAS